MPPRRRRGRPLDGRHAPLACEKCHKTRSFLLARSDCASCHADPHKGALGAQCAKCHATSAAFKDAGRAYDHAASAFPLDGAHVRVACARCHDHKFDPIPQRDYYAIAGVFRSTETCYGTKRIQQNNFPAPLIALKDGKPAFAATADVPRPAFGIEPAGNQHRVGIVLYAIVAVWTAAGLANWLASQGWSARRLAWSLACLGSCLLPAQEVENATKSFTLSYHRSLKQIALAKARGRKTHDVFNAVGADALRWHFTARVAPDVQKRVSVEIIADVASSFTAISRLNGLYGFAVGTSCAAPWMTIAFSLSDPIFAPGPPRA